MAQEIQDPASRGWHLDRRVPMAVITVIIIQSAAILWWAAGVSNAVENNAREIARLDSRFNGIDRERRDLNDRLIRVEEAIKANTKLLEQLVAELRKQRAGLRP